MAWFHSEGLVSKDQMKEMRSKTGQGRTKVGRKGRRLMRHRIGPKGHDDGEAGETVSRHCRLKSLRI